MCCRYLIPNVHIDLKRFHSIRQSTPTWHHTYTTSHDIISSNLFIINPTIVGILDLWDRFKGMRLFDMESIVGKGGSFDLKGFKSMFMGRLEKAGERLMTRCVSALSYVEFWDK